jgi:hypothetical protein
VNEAGVATHDYDIDFDAAQHPNVPFCSRGDWFVLLLCGPSVNWRQVRENRKHGPSLSRKQAVTNDLRAKGLTDYAAWPLYHTLDKRRAVMRPCDQFPCTGAVC